MRLPPAVVAHPFQLDTGFSACYKGGMKNYLASQQSKLIALGLVVALTLWLLSGQWNNDTESKEPVAGEREAVTHVRVEEFKASEISREIVISARTEPARAVTLRAEIDARVTAIGAQRGTLVKQGDVIVSLDVRDRQEQLKEVQALVRQRELEYQGARQLSKQNFQSETQVAQALANLSAARANLKRVQIEIANTTLRAPFDGVLETRPLEVGDYVSVGDEAARILEQDPLLVVGQVSQQEVHQLRNGAPGSATLVTGQQVEGRIRYVASESKKATRTFQVELEVPNPDGELIAGITSELRIPTHTIIAHHLSPALLSLNDANELGVKSVNGEQVVEFHPVQIVRASAEGLWVSELPQTLRIITVGQGFVRPGDKVRATLAEPAQSNPQ